MDNRRDERNGWLDYTIWIDKWIPEEMKGMDDLTIKYEWTVFDRWLVIYVSNEDIVCGK